MDKLKASNVWQHVIEDCKEPFSPLEIQEQLPSFLQIPQASKNKFIRLFSAFLELLGAEMGLEASQGEDTRYQDKGEAVQNLAIVDRSPACHGHVPHYVAHANQHDCRARVCSSQ